MKLINDKDFEEQVLKSKTTVLLYFTAPWCGPCRALAPVIGQLAEELISKVTILKMDVDENPETPSKLNIRGIPTLLLFKHGKIVEQLVGNQSKEVIKKIIENHT